MQGPYGLKTLLIGVGLTLASLAIMVAVVLFAARHQNRLAEEQARMRLQAGFETLLREATGTVHDYSWWTEAYDHRADKDWLDENIGRWVAQTFGAAGALVATPTGSIGWSSLPAAPSDQRTFQGLLADARRSNATTRDQISWAIIQVGGRPMLAAASLVRPYDLPAPAPWDFGHVLLIAWDLEGSVLPKLSKITRIDGLRLTAPPLAAYTPGDGVPLTWQQEHPGTLFAWQVLPVTLAAWGALAALTWVLALRARHQAQALRAADERRLRLLAAIGHDLRQPLQSLSLFGDVVACETLSPKGRRAVDHLRESVTRMGTLLDATLSLARLDLGVEIASKCCFRLTPMLEELVAELRPQAEAKGLRLRVVPSRQWVESDPVLLTAMVRSLISNAVRYTQRGGVLVGARRRHDMVEIWVCDSGIGITQQDQQLVFEEYFQVGNAARTYGRGVGLGLAIVQRLSRLLDHPVAVRSRPGRGSIFIVGVPRSSGHPTPNGKNWAIRSAIAA